MCIFTYSHSYATCVVLLMLVFMLTLIFKSSLLTPCMCIRIVYLLKKPGAHPPAVCSVPDVLLLPAASRTSLASKVAMYEFDQSMWDAGLLLCCSLGSGTVV